MTRPFKPLRLYWTETGEINPLNFVTIESPYDLVTVQDDPDCPLKVSVDDWAFFMDALREVTK